MDFMPQNDVKVESMGSKKSQVRLLDTTFMLEDFGVATM